MNKNKKYKATASVLGDRCVIKVQSYSVLQRFFKTFSAFTLIFLLLLGASIEGVGQIISWDLNGQNGNQASNNSSAVVTGINTGVLTRGTGITTANSAGTMNSSGWETSNSIDPNDYYQFTVPIATGYSANITTIVIALARSSGQGGQNGGADRGVLRSSIDNYASNIGSEVTIGTTVANFTFTFDKTNLTGTITFRLYGYSAENGSGTMRIGAINGNDIAVNGSVIGPNLTVTPTSLAFGYTASGNNSAEQNYVLAGTNLTAPVIVAPPAGFEISTTSGSAYSTSAITLTPSSGSVNQNIYVVFHPTSTQAYSGNITHTSTGAAQKNVALTGTSVLSYCNSYGSMDFADGITLVSFNTINNVTGKPSGYNNYTSQSTDVVVGNTYQLTVNLNTDGDYVNYATVWIDWNQDGDFLDTGESYSLGYTNNNANGITSLSPLNIQVPATAIIGNTRMRVSTQYNQQPGSCSVNFDGEVEDYTMNVTGACTNPTAGGIIATSQTICSGGDPGAFTSTGLPTGQTGTLEYKWQSSTSGSGSGFSDITPGATGLTYDVPSGLTQTTWYKRLSKVTCESVWPTDGESNILEVTVNPAPTLTSISASPASACAGSDVTITVNGLISGLNTISYDYTIDGSTTSSSVNLTPSGGVASTSLNNLPAGNYQVKINSITVNGCTTNFSTNNTANWTISPETTPTFTQLGPYCAGTTPDALPGTSNNGITGTWNPSSINTATSGTIIYTFTPTAGQCATTAAMSVPVNSLPAVFNVTGGGTYCGSALAIGLSDSETGINYQLFRDGSTLVSTVAGTGSPISFVPQSDIGTYTVVANNSVTGCAINMSGSAIISTDSEAPVARCKTNISVNTNAGGQAIITPAMVDNGSTDNCGIMSMIVSPETLSCAGSGSTVITYSKDIVSSNGYTVHISVTDMWVEPSTNNCAVGGYNYTIGYNYSISFSGSGIPSALDNFDIVIGCDHTMYGELPETQGTGTNFTNSQYRSDSDCATVTPDDIHCSVVNVRIQGPGISYQTVTLDPISGSGSNTVTLTVTDAAGNSNSCTTNVTLIDAVSPAITCPANVAVSADANSCSATGVSLETPATDDNCGVASITNNAPASFPVGNTTVTWTVTDNAGNTNTCAQTVTVDPNPVDIEVVDLGNSCQSGETGSQTSVAWTVNKLSGVGSWTYYYEIKNGSTVVANATRTVTGSADSVNFTVNNITNTNLNYTITISGVSDDCGTTETNTANNSDTVTLFGVPDTGDIHTN